MGAEGRILALLSRPDLAPSDLEAILRDPDARRYHSVRLALASHRLTPRAEALSLLETLFSYDLAQLSADVRAHPEVRRTADRTLLRRIAEMAVTERVQLARFTGRGLLAALRADPDPRVVAAFLDNRFATEADVLAALGPRAHPEALAAVARHPRWGLRRPVKEALLAHPRLTEDALTELLERADDEDVSVWSVSRGASPGVRAAAQRILARRRKGG